MTSVRYCPACDRDYSTATELELNVYCHHLENHLQKADVKEKPPVSTGPVIQLPSSIARSMMVERLPQENPPDIPRKVVTEEAKCPDCQGHLTQMATGKWECDEPDCRWTGRLSPSNGGS